MLVFSFGTIKGVFSSIRFCMLRQIMNLAISLSSMGAWIKISIVVYFVLQQ